MDNSGPSFPHGGHAPPQHWFDTWDNRGNQNTSSSALSAKGLRNAPGENNCFLNSAVQVFWHLDVFRRSYRRLTGHLCMGNSCIFCALKVIFTQFQYSDQASLPPDALRKALAESFINQQRFQLGHMDDAAECFENILRRIHFHIANAYSEDACQAPHCLPHQKFAMTVFDQIVCICGASSDPLTFHELVHYISTSALVSQCRSMHETGDILHPDRFGLLLRNAGAVGDIRDCPNSCGKRVQIRRTLLNCPDVVSIGLVWETDRPNTDMISDVVQSIGTTILLQDIFHSVMVKGMKDVSKLPKLQLSALVCYYGKHYSTFVFHTKLNVWIYFDDATVRQVGPSWDDVVEKCCKGHYQPLLLLYTNPNANPIATETAPKKRVMAPGFSTPVKVPSEKKTESRHDGVRRSITPNPDGSETAVPNRRRSTTPNPPSSTEPISPDTEPGVTKKQVEHHRQHSFLIAVTGKTGRAAEQNKSEYAVPMNNTAVKHRLPGGQGQPSGSDYEGRKQRPSDLQLPKPDDSVDGYNYTLSTRDQYRRPSISSPDHTGKPLTPNFSRGEVPIRKDSFKRGKDKVPVDVIRYQVPRTSSTSSDSDSIGQGDHNPANSKSGSTQSTAPVLPLKHRRTKSICHEDAPQNLSADHIDIRQHVVMKPKPSAGHNYENIENISHTPVQSGLATLPRNKKGKSAQQMPQVDKASRPSLHNRQGTQAQSGQMDRIFHSRQNSIGGQTAHSRDSSTHTLTDDRHSRQNSMVSQISDTQGSTSQGSMHSDKVNGQSNPDSHSRREQTKPSIPSNKPPKPAKPEKKPTLSQKKKTSNPPPPPPTRRSELQGSKEDHQSYINRNIVESVLHYQNQKLTRQGSNISSVSQNSNTSFDSDNSSVRSHKDGTTEILFDTLSLDSAHRDSGYGSSDRNSSSSTGSTTLDPYAQYFMSKSMIPPKNLNTQGVAENLKKFINHGYDGDRHYGPTTYTVGSVQHGGQVTVQQTAGQKYPPPDDKYNPDLTYSHGKTSVEAGKPQYPNVDNSQMSGKPTDPAMERKQLYDPAIVKSHTQGKGNQVYHMNQKMMPQDVKPVSGNKCGPEGFSNTSNQKSEKPSVYHEGVDEYAKLCQKAEELMDQCVLVETSENGSMALNYCNAAIDCLKQAMRINSVSQQSFVSAQKMHNSCVLKSRSLQKKFLVRQESMSSTTSSDSARSSPCPISVSSSDHSSSSSQSYGENCVQQNVLISKLQQNSIHSRSSSRDSVDSVIENKNYRKENRTNVKTEKPISESSSSHSANERTSCSQKGSNDMTVDMYATLPRKGTRRSQKVSGSSNPEPDFANKQRSVNGSGNPNGRTASSGSITPTPSDNCFDTDSSLTDGNDYHYKMQVPSQQQVKANRAEIRQLPHNNTSSGSYHPQGYYPQGYTSSRQQDSSYPQPQTAHPTQHQHEVCKTSAPSQSDNPVLPPKPGKSTNLVTQPAKSTSDLGSREASPRPVEGMMKWVRSTSHATPRSVKNKSKQNSVARQSSFTGNAQQQPGQGRSHQSTVSLATKQCDVQPQQHLVDHSSPHSNHSDCSNNEAQSAGFTPEQVPSTLSNIPNHQCGGQSGENRSATPQQMCTDNNEGSSESEEFRPSVRDLASRFEGSKSNVPSCPHPRDQQDNFPPSGNLGRQRSKSESDFRTLDVKPKSVLSRNKQKNKANRMKKSVTFNDNVALVDLMDIFAPQEGAPGYNDNNSGYVSDQEERYDRATRSYSDNELEDDDSVDSPTEIAPGEVACSLCGKHGAQYGQYCEKCHFYLSQFQQRRC